jgi:hypothetical protein
MIQFQQDALDEASDLYNQAQITSSQTQIIHVLSSKLCEYIPMDILPMKGFALYAAIAWQKEHHMLASEIENFTPEQRMQFMKYALNHIKTNIIRTLRNKADTGKIEEGIHAIFEYYKTTFVQR